MRAGDEAPRAPKPSPGTTAELETARLRLRRWRAGDLEPYSRIVSDPEVSRYINFPHHRPLSRAEAKDSIARFERMWEERGYGHWAAEDKVTGEFVGRAGLLHHSDWPLDPDNVEVGWLMDRAVWGRGLATECALASLAFAFRELNAARVISIIHPHNRGSRRVAEKAGLSLSGEAHWKGERVVWYSLERS